MNVSNRVASHSGATVSKSAYARPVASSEKSAFSSYASTLSQNASRSGPVDVPLSPCPPRCPSCGGLARPGVVWFGETLDPADLQLATEACVCDVFMVVGTSAVVHPAAGLADIARAHGAFLIEINPETTPVSDAVDVSIRGAAEIVLDAFDQ